MPASEFLTLIVLLKGDSAAPLSLSLSPSPSLCLSLPLSVSPPLSLSGRVLAQASGNGVIHLLDLKSGQIHKLMGHESEAHTVIFSRDGETLFSGGSDGTVRTWS